MLGFYWQTGSYGPPAPLLSARLFRPLAIRRNEPHQVHQVMSFVFDTHLAVVIVDDYLLAGLSHAEINASEVVPTLSIFIIDRDASCETLFRTFPVLRSDVRATQDEPRSS